MSKKREEKEEKPMAEDKLETNPDQLALIVFDSSGEVERVSGDSPNPPPPQHQA